MTETTETTETADMTEKNDKKNKKGKKGKKEPTTIKTRVRFSFFRLLRLGTNATIMTIAFLGILVLLNIVIMRYHLRWDLTATGEFSLSEQSIQIIRSVEQPVEIIGFFPQHDARYREQQETVESKLKEYTTRSEHISYRAVDLDADPITARMYEVQSPGTLVFQSGNTQEKVMGTQEQALTAALLKVTQEAPTTVYFLAGHGERSLEDFGRRDFAMARQLLEQDSFHVERLNLFVTDTIPVTHTVLVVADPFEPPLQPEEEAIIEQYIEQGGRMMLLSDPGSSPPLGDLLARVGLTWNDDVIIDQQAQRGLEIAPIVIDYPPHQITEDLQQRRTVFLSVRSLSRNEMEPAGVTRSTLLQSSPTSQAATDIADGQVRLQPGDRTGPLDFGYAIEGSLATPGSPTMPDASQTRARMVVIGDADFASNELLGAPATVNAALFRNAIAWLAEEEALISLPPKPEVDRTIMLTPNQERFVLYSSMAGLPLLVLITGVVVGWLRR